MGPQYSSYAVFLDTKTRRKIVKLARKPVKEINVLR